MVFLSTYQIPLGQIESVRLNEKTYHVPSSTEYHHTRDPVSYSELIFVSAGPAILETRESTGTGPTGQTVSRESITDSFASASIGSDDPVIASRLLAAFKHAVELCRASKKPEPF